MKHQPIHDTRFFFATAPLPCPYLPDRVERRVVTELLGRDAVALHDGLSEAGFRRSHNIAYAPACPECQACKAVRILARQFEPSRSQRRIWNKNLGLEVFEKSPIATQEQYDLFARYQNSRHRDGDMAKMDFRDYQALIEETPVDSSLVEFRDLDHGLIGACLMDRVDDGLSAVYSFFDPERYRDSLGTLMVLWMINRARALGLQYVYLGFWIADCSKMSYKAKFQPMETLSPEGWQVHVAENPGA